MTGKQPKSYGYHITSSTGKIGPRYRTVVWMIDAEDGTSDSPTVYWNSPSYTLWGAKRAVRKIIRQHTNQVNITGEVQS